MALGLTPLKTRTKIRFFLHIFTLIELFFVLSAIFRNFSYFCIRVNEKMSRYIDIHTHHPTRRHIEPQAVGIHPWQAEGAQFSPSIFDGAAAVGEIGLDYARDVDHNAQQRLFDEQLREAERLGLPVILHCVRAFEPMMKMLSRRNLRAVVFHGFIGSLQQAERAVDRGYYLSFGEGAFRSPKTVEVMRRIPLSHLFAETDESDCTIEEIYRRIAQVREISVEELQTKIEENYKRIFCY